MRSPLGWTGVRMTTEIAPLRLVSQQLAAHSHKTVEELVAMFGAMQAQEYRSVLWAVGLRLHNASETDVGQALASGATVRTWTLRGTLHLVAAQDVRWMLALVAPRAIAQSSSRRRQLEIDEPVLKASRRVIEQALSDGGRLTRDDAFTLLERAGIKTAGQRGIHILRQLSLEGLLVQTGSAGRQATFALLDSVIPDTSALPADEALGQLAWRYFTSHGPATLRDFAWWSGFGAADAKKATESAADRLMTEEIKGTIYWMAMAQRAPKSSGHIVHVLPGFDEYILGYNDRRGELDEVASTRILRGGMFRPAILVDGRAVGTWSPGTAKRPSSVNETSSPLDAATSKAIDAALSDYDTFIGKKAASA
jgi:hypothetical protein